MNRIITVLAILFVSVAIACGISTEEYGSVVAELERAKGELSATNDSLADTSGNLDMTQAGLDEALLRLSAMEIEVVKLTISLDEAIEENNVALAEISLELEDALAELDAASRSMDVFQVEMAKIAAELSAKRSEVERLESENSSLEEDLVSSNAAVDDLEAQFDGISSALDAKNQELAQASDDLDELEKDVSSLEIENVSLSNELEVNSASHIQAEIQELKNERDEWIIKIDQLGGLVQPLLSDPDIDLKASGIYCTGSMLPTLHCGDIVFLQTNLAYRDIEVGDIISFRRRDCFGEGSSSDIRILHRVVGTDGGWFITKGDNNYSKDSCRLPLINIEGEVITWMEELYPEDFFETVNFEAEKANLNSLFRTYDLKNTRYEDQLDELDDAEDDYKDGRISYGKYIKVWNETEEDRLELNDLLGNVKTASDMVALMQNSIVDGTYQDSDWD